MKLVRFETGGGGPRLGVVLGEGVVDLGAVGMVYPSMLSIIEGGRGVPSTR